MGTMAEENPGGLPPRRSAGNRDTRSGRKGHAEKKPALAGMQVILVQSISCIVVVLLVLVIKLVGGDAFAQLRQQFNESIMSNSIIATLASLFETPYADDTSSLPDGSMVSPESGPPASSDSSSSAASSGEETSAQTDSSEASGSGTTTDAAQTGGTTAASSPAASSSPSGGTTAQAVRYAPEGSSFTTVHANRLAAAPLPTGKVTSPYGYRENPTKEGTGFHKGIDIGAPEGTPIRAMYFGVVTAVGEEAGYGKYVKLFHGNGVEILYAHCSEILVEKDAVIRAGETVAKVGSTGDSTGFHLHVELRVNGITYNPAGMLPAQLYA